MTKPPWTHRVKVGKASVLVYVDPDRKNKLTLKWRDGGKPKKATLDRTAEPVRGKLSPEDEQFAIGAAMKKALELSGQAPAAVVAASGKPLTIADAEPLIIDPKKGKYQHRKPFRDELVRSLRFACAVWGAGRAWITIEESDWTELLRARLDQLLAKGAKGDRATQITVSGLITTVRWLRRMRYVPRDAAPWPDDWKQQIEDHWKGEKKTSRSPEPDRPRFTLEEAQAILGASNFDPRFHLLMWLGMELRLGQVARTRRSDLRIGPIGDGNYGTAMIHGSGKKGGAAVLLTKGQRHVIDAAIGEGGFLHPYEVLYQATGQDYPLFPAGYIVGRVGRNRGKETVFSMSEKASGASVTSSWIRKNFREAEEKAGVEHQRGRGAYGVRRVSVDVAKDKNLSVHGLQASGGWKDTKMPLTVYAEKDNEAGQREAQPFRAHLRGEDKGE